MGLPVVVAASGGLPVTVVTNGLPVTLSTNGLGVAVTQATSGGLGVTGVTFGPDVTAPVITSSNSVSNVENTVLAHTLTANEPVTWAIVAGGADNARFELSGSTLRWLSNGTKDFEAPNDANVDNAYIVTVRATDLAANPSTTQTITVTVTNADEVAPTITSASTVNNEEDTVLAHALTANETVTWAIIGGADAARFELSGSTLRWLSNGTKDFEAPNDADANNAYIVQVRATDTAGNQTNQTITATVTNALEAAPAAPVLDLLTDGTDNTPDFTLTGDLALSDTVRFQYGTASDFTGASEITNAIDAGEDAANAISFSTGALANGTWYFRARIERPGHTVSGWSNTETIAISVVSAYTGPADIVTLSAFYGLRAAGSAYTETPAVRLIRSSDSAQADISTLEDGSLDTANAFFNGSTYKVVTLYDQLNGAYGDLLPASAGARPTFTLSGLNGMPTIDFGTGTDMSAITSAIGPTAQPVFYLTVIKRAGDAGTQNTFMCDADVTQVGWQGLVPNSIMAYADNGLAVTSSSDATFHACAVVFNGASSTFRVDGNVTTGNAGTHNFYYGIALNPSNIGGRGTEFAFGFGNVTSSLATLVTNQTTYWGPF